MADGESQLAKRAARGDMAALEALYRRYVDRVWRYALHRTRRRDEAAEIVQETFLRVLRSIKQFKGRSTFGTWLFTVTRSVAIERARRETRHRSGCEPSGLLRLIAADDDAPDPPAVEEVCDATRQAVSGLPGAQRDAIVLYELSGFAISEVAEILGWGEPRVKVTLFRARRRLRDRLRPYVSGDAADAAEVRGGRAGKGPTC